MIRKYKPNFRNLSKENIYVSFCSRLLCEYLAWLPWTSSKSCNFSHCSSRGRREGGSSRWHIVCFFPVEGGSRHDTKVTWLVYFHQFTSVQWTYCLGSVVSNHVLLFCSYRKWHLFFFLTTAFFLLLLLFLTSNYKQTKKGSTNNILSHINWTPQQLWLIKMCRWSYFLHCFQTSHTSNLTG